MISFYLVSFFIPLPILIVANVIMSIGNGLQLLGNAIVLGLKAVFEDRPVVPVVNQDIMQLIKGEEPEDDNDSNPTN